MTLLFEWSSTRASWPVTSLIMPVLPLYVPRVTATRRLMRWSGRKLVPVWTCGWGMPPAMAGFMPMPTLGLLGRGAVDSRLRAYETKTPPCSSASRVWRKTKSER